MNPNGLVPTLEEEDGFLLWESNTIVRYLAAKHKATVLEPADLRTRALASKWMDWQFRCRGPAITPVFWGLIRTPPEKRDHAAIEEGKKKTTAAISMMDEQLGKTAYLAGDAFSYGDIPVGIMAYRYRQLVPERPPLRNFERWYAAISSRQAFKDQVARGAAVVSVMIQASVPRWPRMQPSKDVGRGAETVDFRGSHARDLEGDGTDLLRRGPGAAECAETM